MVGYIHIDKMLTNISLQKEKVLVILMVTVCTFKKT
jgi:hypothetical protein